MIHSSRLILLASCMAVTAAHGSAAQGRLLVRNPIADHLGASLAAAGDVDADGLTDLIVGAPQPRADAPGYAAIHSGKDGALLRRIEGRAPGDCFGYAVEGGEDVDGDGRPDCAVSALHWRLLAEGGSSYVTIRSGADGSSIHELEQPAAGELYGQALLLLGDCNGDGRSELVVAAPSADLSTAHGPGHVYVHDGATGAVLHTLVGPHRRSRFGTSLARAGDLDADGAADFLIGAPGGVEPGRGEGFVRAISGKTGAALFELSGHEEREGFGAPVAPGGDFDGDGRPDFLIASEGNGGAPLGALRAISSATRATLLAFPEERGGFHPGRASVLAADLDGDGASELLVADPLAPGALLRIYASSGSHEDAPIAPSNPRGGLRLCSLGDVDGDGADDFALSSPWATAGPDPTGRSAGAVTVYSGRSCTPLFTIQGS